MTALSFEQAPPWGVPHRFFLTAPLFGVAAGLLLAFEWEAVTASRWAPQTVAVVHLVTAGLMLQVMAGALLQVMPVAAGANVWRPRLVAGLAHPCLALGAAGLAGGFLGLGARSLRLAVVLLSVGALVYGLSALVALLRSPAIGPTVHVLRAAATGFLVATGLGVTLATTFGWSLSLSLGTLLDLHVAWAGLGWALLLVMGVAYLVVPMFQLTPAYPVAAARTFPSLVGAALGAWSAGALTGLGWLGSLGVALGALGAGGFAVQTLRLQAKRRRKVSDTTLRAWRFAMACLLGAGLLVPLVRLLPADSEARGRVEYLLGALVFGGAFPAVIGGMLYKVVGFLGWLHLQKVVMPAPAMQKFLPEERVRWQARVFVAAFACLALAAAWPVLAVPGGLLFAAACALLEWHLLLAVRFYREQVARAAGGATP